MRRLGVVLQWIGCVIALPGLALIRLGEKCEDADHYAKFLDEVSNVPRKPS
jgi:hypothetical protein